MLNGLHYARALAAIAVVLFHAFEMLEKSGYASISRHFILATGVDVFFVLSGFLMVFTTQKYSAGSLDWRGFLRSRILRVGPIYWFLTAAVGGAILMKPSLSDRPITALVLLKSMLFLPSILGSETIQTTILPVGWTLVYEFFFYVLFAFVMALNYRRGLMALPILLGCMALGHGTTSNFYLEHYSNPLILEFGFGSIVAACYLRFGFFGKCDQWIFVALVAAGTTWIVSWAQLSGPNFHGRPFFCGIGAAMIILGAAGLRFKASRLMMFLGNASYSIYLTHLYGMKYIGLRFAGVMGVFGMLLIGVAFGVLVYLLAERPLARYVKLKLSKS